MKGHPTFASKQEPYKEQQVDNVTQVFKQALHGLIWWPSDSPLGEAKTGMHSPARTISTDVLFGLLKAAVKLDTQTLACALHSPCDVTILRKRPELKLIVTSVNFSEEGVLKISPTVNFADFSNTEATLDAEKFSSGACIF